MAGRKQAGDSWRGASRRLAELFLDQRTTREQSQESVARAAGLALSTVRKIEKNRIREPGVFTVLALMDALDLPISRLQEVARSDPPAEEEVTPDTLSNTRSIMSDQRAHVKASKTPRSG